MRRSGRSGSQDSLELFLDAISNAFGAVIFIALLVCVLLQLSGKAVPKPARRHDEDYAEWVQTQLRKAKSDAEELASWQSRWLARIRTMARDRGPDLTDSYGSLVDKKERRDAQYARLQGEDATVRRDVDKYRGALKDLKEKKEKLEGKLATIIAALERLTRANAYQIRLPEAKETEKKPVVILVAGGRAALVHRYDPQGRALGANAAEVEQGPIVTAPGSGDKMTSYRKRPDKGVLIAQDGRFRTALGGQLRMFKPTTHYIVLSAWEDSFPELERIRDWLTDEMRYEYGLQLFKKNEWIKASPRAAKTRIQ